MSTAEEWHYGACSVDCGGVALRRVQCGKNSAKPITLSVTQGYTEITRGNAEVNIVILLLS